MTPPSLLKLRFVSTKIVWVKIDRYMKLINPTIMMHLPIINKTTLN